MARRSKEFGELIRQNKNARARQYSLEQLKQDLQQSPLGELTDIIIEPTGERKMSEVLNEFIEPYRANVRNAQEHRKLLDLAVMAWNASFFPPEEQEQLIHQLVNEGMKDADAEVQQDLRDLLAEFIARKNRYFAQEERLILDFNLQDTGTDYHLSVASSPSKNLEQSGKE